MSHLPPRMLRLDIIVREPEVVSELSKFHEGTESRDEFVLSAPDRRSPYGKPTVLLTPMPSAPKESALSGPFANC